jgi:hypothetical protein
VNGVSSEQSIAQAVTGGLTVLRHSEVVRKLTVKSQSDGVQNMVSVLSVVQKAAGRLRVSLTTVQLTEVTTTDVVTAELIRHSLITM